MAACSPPAPFLCVLLCVSVALQRSDLHLAYVTHNSFLYYSCSQDPQPCSISSLTDCVCKDIQLSTLHRLQSHLSPVFQMRRLTVWFTSPSNAARLLNNSEVRHLTLIYCGSSGMPPLNPEGYFAVHHLERLTVVNLPQKPFYPYPDLNRAKTGDPDRENNADLDTNRLGIIHKSVLEGGAVVKAYTVKTHIDSSGALPFPELHLPKLPETSVIYVTFVY
uniref:Uncharacterized LOC102789763 n=1 Tax=Neolamprologus brichardi TaxID=32507 RepID=A0A3Q4HLF5_NEOBR